MMNGYFFREFDIQKAYTHDANIRIVLLDWEPECDISYLIDEFYFPTIGMDGVPEE